MLTIVVFLVILSILVLVHEFGHFLVGKLAGIGVEEFALGLPFTKPLLSKKLRGGMLVSLYPVLFGGFVKLLGEEGTDEPLNRKVSGQYFYQMPVWTRIGVVAAGVFMNLILAIVTFYLFLALSNFRVLVPKLADYNFFSPHRTLIAIGLVQDNTPAKEAGIRPGDVITGVDGRSFSRLRDFQDYTRSRAGQEIRIELSDVTLTSHKQLTITPRANPPPGQGPLGIGIDEAIMLSFTTPPERALSGVSYTADMFIYNLQVLGKYIFQAAKTGNVAPLSESVSGPVGIASAVNLILDLGGERAVAQLINLMGLLSLSLAFMNVLPFPALDGGRLAFLLVEAVAGKKMAAKNENLINQIGMALLLGLILLISINDVRKVLVESGVIK